MVLGILTSSAANLFLEADKKVMNGFYGIERIKLLTTPGGEQKDH
jgi:hypothetical protein